VSNVAFLVSGRRPSAEEIAALTFARRLGASILPFGSLPGPATLLRKFRVMWWHYNRSTSLPAEALTPEHIALFRTYVESGGSLLLTLLAAPYACDLGFESARPDVVVRERWKEESWAKGHPDVRGLAGFRGHPVFAGLHGGAFTWIARKGRSSCAAIYTGRHCPTEGKVVAVERQYIRLIEDRRIAAEYSAGRGRILTIGTHFFFSAGADPFRPHLERLARNCISHLSDPGPSLQRTYWSCSPSIPRREDRSSRKEKLRGNRGTHPDSGLSMVREPATEQPFDLGGTRILIAGREKSGVDEIWVHPVRILRNLRVSTILPGGQTVPLSRLHASVTVRPESIIREIAIGLSRLTETIFADPSSPAGALQFHLHGHRQIRLIFRGVVDLRIMWPLPADAAGGLVYGWDDGLNILRVRSADGSLVSLLGTGRKPDAVRLFANRECVGFEITCTLERGSSGVAFCFSGSGNGERDAEGGFRRLVRNPAAAHARQASHFRKLFAKRTMVTSSDSLVNEAYRWALAGTDRFRAWTPGTGLSLMAGYGTTASGWDGGQKISGRPGYAWYFGRDSVWTALAMLAYGDFAAGRSVLQFLGTHQEITGKIPHEVTTSGHAHFDAADATPLYLLLMGRYLRASGDKEFVRHEYEGMKKAVLFSLSTDTDGDHLIENTSAGHGWVEGGALFPVHAEIYLNACWSAALGEAAYCARITGHMSDATHWGREALRVRRTIERQFWDGRKKFYCFGKRNDGSFNRNETVMPAVLLALNTCSKKRADAVLRKLGSSHFTTPWGTRIVGDSSRLYDPAGYHYGSVWPLFTGWVALAAFRQGDPQLGFRMLQCMAGLHTKFSAGYVPEVIHGEHCTSAGVCTHQAWSESMVLQPILEGLCGLKPDAVSETLTLRPILPDQWSRMELARIRVGPQLVDVKLRRTQDGVRCSLKLRSGSGLRVILETPSGKRRTLKLLPDETGKSLLLPE
jgi:glycogen debranching enzyme